jgi:hypothetical protein
MNIFEDVPMLEKYLSLDPIHEYFNEKFEDQAPQDFIEEQKHEERFMKEVIKLMKKTKSHLVNLLKKKTLMKHIMLKIKSVKKTY